MAKHEAQQVDRIADKPGTGIDRTVIRQLLELTPGERMKLVDNDADILTSLDRAAAQLRKR